QAGVDRAVKLRGVNGPAPRGNRRGRDLYRGAVRPVETQRVFRAKIVEDDFLGFRQGPNRLAVDGRNRVANLQAGFFRGRAGLDVRHDGRLGAARLDVKAVHFTAGGLIGVGRA